MVNKSDSIDLPADKKNFHINYSILNILINNHKNIPINVNNMTAITTTLSRRLYLLPYH